VQVIFPAEICANKQNVMKKNMGLTDRIIRTSLAIVLIVLFFTGIIPGTTGIIMTAIAGVLLLTSVAGFCPLYIFLNINTCKR
jgi:hypothetical protein